MPQPRRFLLSVCLIAAMATMAGAARAQVVTPGAADASRVNPLDKPPTLERPPAPARISSEGVTPPVVAPEGAAKVTFTLRQLHVKGATAVSEQELRTLYAPLIGQRVTLLQMYELAARITNLYRQQGYLLSYAYVPDQEAANGEFTLAVAEGYLATVTVEGDDPNAAITRDYIERLKAEKPLTDRTVESILLRLNDLPGASYRAVLSRDKLAPPEQVSLTLVPGAKDHRASIGFDNFSSRYLGPNEISASYTDSFLPRQQTSIYTLTSIPIDRLNYGAITHSWVAAPDLTLEGSFSFTHSEPGYTLSPLNIDSSTKTYGISANYQLIRQRDENLLVKLGGEWRAVRSDVFGSTPLTRDDIRLLHGTASFDANDGWGGTNIVNAVVTQGLDIFNATGSGSANPSRREEKPDFTKVELSLSHLQPFGDDWAVLLQANGQIATGALYASEEFGVGGQAYGRAYDASEIVGDQGAAGMIELRYTGLRTLQPVNVEPYIYADTGFVTNFDAGQPGRESLTSAGGGLRFATIWGQSGMVGLAFPLSRPVAAPIYGQTASSPRILAQVAQSF